jgi:hypothetical protein
MRELISLFDVTSTVGILLLAFSFVLFLILIVSFRSRPTMFCQYLNHLTGIKLRPADVKRAYLTKGQDGVREMFLELIIAQDLKQGPMVPPGPVEVPAAATSAEVEVPPT